MMASLLMLLIGTSLAQPARGGPSNSRIDRVLAVVEDRIVTESDLRLEELLQRVDAIVCPPLAPPQSDLLRLLEDRRILQRLAAGRTFYTPSNAEVALRMGQLSEKLGEDYAPFLHRWGLDEAKLARLLSQRMVEEAYVERNLGRALQTEQFSDSETREKRYRQRYLPWMNDRREATNMRRIQGLKP
jgi:hypothetical protein